MKSKLHAQCVYRAFCLTHKVYLEFTFYSLLIICSSCAYTTTQSWHRIVCIVVLIEWRTTKRKKDKRKKQSHVVTLTLVLILVYYLSMFMNVFLSSVTFIVSRTVSVSQFVAYKRKTMVV